MRRNGIDPGLVRAIAVSDFKGEYVLHFAPEASNRASANAGALVGRRTEQISVPACSLDDLYGNCGGPLIAVIKIDVEGSEISVLRGARRLLQVQHPWIIFEYNQAAMGDKIWAIGEAVEEILKAGAYSFHQLCDDGRLGPLPSEEDYSECINVVAAPVGGANITSGLA
jgi:FkbM family methyltransferase